MPPSPTYARHLARFLDFVLVYVHTVLALRALYPPSSFVSVRFHDTPVFQSRHAALCAWITKAVAALHAPLLAGDVARIALVVHQTPSAMNGRASKDSGSNTDTARGVGPGSAHGGTLASVPVFERFLLDVSHFPAIAQEEHEIEVVSSEPQTLRESYELDGSDEDPGDSNDSNHGDDDDDDDDDDGDDYDDGDNFPTSIPVSADLAEEFRAVLLVLTARCSRLAPLPARSSFNLAVELKRSRHSEPHLGPSRLWIPVQSLLQTSRAAQSHSQGQWHGFGRVRTTPVRAVQLGLLKFDAWIEEGKAKFHPPAGAG